MGEGRVYALLCVLCAVKLARYCSPAENTRMAVVKCLSGCDKVPRRKCSARKGLF